VEQRISDAEIMARVGGGEADMFRAIVDRYARRLFACAWRYTGNDSDAEEIVQEALLRAYRSAKSYDPARPFLPWLFTIVTNLCHTWHKAQRQTLSLDKEDRDGRRLMEQLAANDPHPERTALEKETGNMVRRALDSLPAIYRDVFLLYYYENMSQGDIARVFSIPLGTVKSRMHNGEKMLAKILLRGRDI